ncbi:MAG: hypothetical protein B6I22_05980 [Desulfobacteraceae bacterium 4572_123]|nr:MAG: hypothetical protein B6I22_05980 [Desulfobacteraceae bacterium 4572_123]
MQSPGITPGHSIYTANCRHSCELSALNIGKVLEFLRQNGYTITDDIGLADVVLINSCCVISGKRNLVRSALEMALNSAHIEKIILFGCFAGIQTGKISKIIKIPSKSIEQIDDYFDHHISIENIEIQRINQNIFTPYQASFDSGLNYVLISQGCVNRCSYCNIKNAKGEVQSRPVDEIVEDIRKRITDDAKEFILAADDCGSYGRDIGTDIVSLIRKIFASDPRIKIRLHYLFPRVLIENEQAFMALFATGRITYVNFPIQSGAQRILNLMNRSYDIVQVLHIVSHIKRMSPRTWLYTHIIVNFPTETERDLQASLHASEIFDEALFMNYSKNPLTPAFRLPDVDKKQKQRTLKTVSAFLKTGHKGLLIDSDSGAPL